MSKTKPTYQDLFGLLDSLGFVENERSREQGPYVFFREKSNTLLAFNRAGSEPVTSADLLSTEVHLQSSGIIKESLESLLSVGAAR